MFLVYKAVLLVFVLMLGSMLIESIEVKEFTVFDVPGFVFFI